MKEAYLYEKLKHKKVRCLNCTHHCILSPKKRGICGVRENIDGKLYSLTYGKVCAIEIDPIEKKPFFHFAPGTKSLSVATVGCQFSCKSCQNWVISQGPKLSKKIEGENISPKKIVEIAKNKKLPSISYTYTDPTVFSEYAIDTMKEARKQGIKNVWVTAGFLSKELLNLISPYLDAINVDIKGFSNKFYNKYCGGRLAPVLETCKNIKKKNIWLETTTLVLPTLNDSEKTLKNIAKFIKNELGPETPWHISQFCGAISWKLKHIPDTPIQTLKKTYKIGKDAGLKYVYIGNIASTDAENTYCPKCGTKAIQRNGYFVKKFDKNGKCPKCNEDLNLILK
ncbi:MAG: AmmeMemoRadiSam system radical SAM enzyme [Patescibacteria group bacterium]|nr:AmmeMemoRadiSam system radical SAM enzyme [Patescibacteria group bacterium]